MIPASNGLESKLKKNINNKKSASLPSYISVLILRINQKKTKDTYYNTQSNIRISILLTLYCPILHYRCCLTYIYSVLIYNFLTSQKQYSQ